MQAKNNGNLYAVKVIHKLHMEKEKKEYQVNAERAVLVATNSFNIVKLYYTFRDSERLYFALEYVPNGELHELLKVAKRLSFPLAQFYAAEMVNMLEYLHSKGIVHQDLKPENILLSEDWHLKLADFGTAKFLANEEESLTDEDFVGTAEYVSPEVLMNKRSTPASDLWALGCIVYEFFVGKTPFDKTTEYWTFEAITNGKFICPDWMNADAAALCRELLVVEPSKRLGCSEKGMQIDYDVVRGHRFFAGIEFRKLPEIKPPIEPGLIEKLKANKLKREERKKKAANNGDKDMLIKQETILKRCGWLFYKKRRLILTAKPLLSYYDPSSNEHRGDIPLERGVRAVKVDDKKFNVVTESRVYYFKGTESADDWISKINNCLLYTSPSPRD
eukprot:TRINITY_DN7974_c0_g3_i4.p1 TRINITY_DN7974_c0_g3~~TRINITY_DN7974_c0_g3_i4.p1  ORF type:complete len:389 (+),score=116.70 TRINITY_DN7974_c0_g3_i4:425-1591(+)